jgi:kynurenine formamidase
MKIIDLTHAIENGMPVYPGDPEVHIEQIQTIVTHGWNMKRLHINTHDGTHVNAQVHCIENGKTLDEYSLTDFCGECIVYEKIADIQPAIGIIFREQIDMDIAQAIVKVKPRFIGFTVEADEDIEKYLLKHDIVIFERLKNTEKLPKKFTFFGVPLKITNGDGSPVRAFAVV